MLDEFAGHGFLPCCECGSRVRNAHESSNNCDRNKCPDIRCGWVKTSIGLIGVRNDAWALSLVGLRAGVMLPALWRLVAVYS
ncbi:hypothetical protein D3C72_2316310 [compost metagenome]